MRAHARACYRRRKSAAETTDNAAPLKAEEERLQYAIKQLSRSNEEVQADIAAVDEALEYLQEQRELWPHSLVGEAAHEWIGTMLALFILIGFLAAKTRSKAKMM